LFISWFKRWLGKNDHQRISLEGMTCSIDVLSESVSKNEIGIQKGLRRLSMAQKQQSDTLALLAQESASLKFALNERHGLILTYEQILQILDNLSKIDHVAGNATYPNGVMGPLIERAITDLLSQCALEAVAEIGKPYPAKACEVVGAIDAVVDEAALEQPQWPPGTVIEVLQQGYQTAQGEVVRVAKVIVSQGPVPVQAPSTQTMTHLEETGHAG
jgi:hypothetical protein